MNYYQIWGMVFTILGIILGSYGTLLKNKSNKDEIKKTIKDEGEKRDKANTNAANQTSKELTKQRISETFYKQKEIFDKTVNKLSISFPTRNLESSGETVIKDFGNWTGIILHDVRKNEGAKDVKGETRQIYTFIHKEETKSFESKLNSFCKMFLNQINDGDEENGYILDEFERMGLASLFTANYDTNDLKRYLSTKKEYLSLVKSKSVESAHGWLDQEIRKCGETKSLIETIEKIAKG